MYFHGEEMNQWVDRVRFKEHFFVMSLELKEVESGEEETSHACFVPIIPRNPELCLAQVRQRHIYEADSHLSATIRTLIIYCMVLFFLFIYRRLE